MTLFVFVDVNVSLLCGHWCGCRLATSQETSELSAEQLAESSVFVLKGVAKGTAILLFNSTSTSGHVITSWPVEIQVTYTLYTYLPKISKFLWGQRFCEML